MIAVYARQSVDKVDSISIESQIEFCKYEARGEEFVTYKDKGFSGKNTDRPEFQEMVSDIKKGKISKVIVYKLDRISRSILDFASIMQMFDLYKVEFVSSTEKFDTSTPTGRAMLNICVVFAQLERETIQKRVLDAYHSRSKKGFYMGGRLPYGFTKKQTVISGVNTSMYEVVEEEIKQIKLIYDLYASWNVSAGDVTRYLVKHNMANLRCKCWRKARIPELIKNPVYVQADLDVYNFFKDRGTIIVNDPSEFTGVKGCYLYTGDNAERRKYVTLKDQCLVLAPHDGVIPSDIWLKAVRKCYNNRQPTKPLKAKNTWLAGKIKCIKCGHALTIRKWTGKTHTNRYFHCSGQENASGACTGIGCLKADIVEKIVSDEMKIKLSQFEKLTLEKATTVNPKINELSAKISQIDSEIDSLVSKLPSATDTLMTYINERVGTLDKEKKEISDEISLLSSNRENLLEIGQITNHVDNWEKLSFDEKRMVVDALIEVVRADKNSVEIIWKI